MGLFACPFSLCGVEIGMVFGNIGLSGQNHPGLSVRALVPRKAVFVLGPWNSRVASQKVSFPGILILL